MVDKTEKFRWLVRLGYFSRAVLYIVLGYIALTSASEISEGTDGIFKAVEDLPAGDLLLWILVAGLVGYALFRLASPLFDIENNGSDTTGWAKRIGHAGSAIAHLALAWTAYRFATGSPSSGDSSASEAAGGLLSMDLGGLVLGLLGVAFLIAAFVQAKKAWTGEFMHRIHPDAPSATRWLGGVGYAARTVVFVVIGWSLIETGFLAGGAQNVKTLGSAVASLAGTGWLFTLTAAGLLIFGLFSLILARYRIIPELGAQGIRPAFRS